MLRNRSICTYTGCMFAYKISYHRDALRSLKYRKINDSTVQNKDLSSDYYLQEFDKIMLSSSYLHFIFINKCTYNLRYIYYRIL